MTGAAVGLALGLLTGGATHGTLILVKDASDRVFYTVWGAGFFVRLLSVAAAVWLLYVHPSLPLVPTVLAMIAGQMAAQLVPLRSRRGRRAGGRK